MKLNIQIGQFHKYDFGSEENSRIYGSAKPAKYNLANIKTKIHILYGAHDNLVMQRVNITIIFRYYFKMKKLNDYFPEYA